MAINLVKAGHEVRVFDLSPDAIATLVEAGATAVNVVEEVCENADFVVSMLPAGKHVKAIYTG